MENVIHAVMLRDGEPAIAGYSPTADAYFTPLCRTPEAFGAALRAVMVEEEAALLAWGTGVLAGTVPAHECIDLAWLSTDAADTLWPLIRQAAERGAPVTLDSDQVACVVRTLQFFKDTHEGLFYGRDHGLCLLR